MKVLTAFWIFTSIEFHFTSAKLYAGTCQTENYRYEKFVCDRSFRGKIVKYIPKNASVDGLFKNYFGSMDCAMVEVTCDKPNIKQISLNPKCTGEQRENDKECKTAETRNFSKRFALNFFPLHPESEHYLEVCSLNLFYVFWSCTEINGTTSEQGLIVIYNQDHLRDRNVVNAHIYIFNIMKQLNINAEDLSFDSFNFNECPYENCQKSQRSDGIHYWIALAIPIMFLFTIAVLIVLNFVASMNKK